jgi:hypothetical protein
MTIRMVRILLIAAMVLVAFGAVIGAGWTVAAAIGGQAEATTLPLKIEGAASQPVLDRAGVHPVGALILDHGTLKVRAGGAGYAVLQLVDILLVCGLWLLILATTLRLVGQISKGRPFEALSVTRLRRIGWSLIALNLWAWLRMIALPPVLLSNISPVAGDYRILPSIAEGIGGAQNARVDSTFGLGLLAAGLLILVLAQAFKVGADLREDSEAIV